MSGQVMNMVDKIDKIVEDIKQQNIDKTYRESHIFIPVCVICLCPFDPQLVACPICRLD